MCELCRDLRPADCPGCVETTEEDVEAFMMMDIHDEMYREVGEPRE